MDFKDQLKATGETVSIVGLQFLAHTGLLVRGSGHSETVFLSTAFLAYCSQNFNLVY